MTALVSMADDARPDTLHHMMIFDWYSSALARCSCGKQRWRQCARQLAAVRLPRRFLLCLLVIFLPTLFSCRKYGTARAENLPSVWLRPTACRSTDAVERYPSALMRCRDRADCRSGRRPRQILLSDLRMTTREALSDAMRINLPAFYKQFNNGDMLAC